MCLIINEKTRKQLTKKDKVVYKIVIEKDNGFYTPYKNCLVSIGEKYTSELIPAKEFIDVKFYNYIEVGLHSIKKYKDILREVVFFKSLCDYKDGAKIHIVKCIIPKGGYYYKGIYDYLISYASDAIIYKEIIKTFQKGL